MRGRRSVPPLCRNTDNVAVQPWPACRRLLCRTAYQWHPRRRHGRSRGRQQCGYADDDEKYNPHWYAKNFRCNEINDVKHSNPMRRQCQFTVKQSVVSHKCAVRDGVMYYNSGRPAIGPLLGSGPRQPEVPTWYVLPVTPSIRICVSAAALYRSGLVRLLRRIAAKITSAPSLNCVLVIATQ